MLHFLYTNYHINIFQYLTVRAGIAFFVALILTMYLVPKFIKWASGQFDQPIYDLVEQHQNKKQIPTMGGLIFLFATLVASILSIDIFNLYAWTAILTIILFSAIGIRDDLMKIRGKKNSAGLTAKSKIILQIIAGLIISGILYFIMEFPTDFYVPFLKIPVFDMGIFFFPFFTIILLSATNAVNLTDGLDGLVTVPAIFAIMTLSVFAYLSGNIIFSKYLLIPFIHGVGETIIIGSALIGALTGFLWFNAHPAEIFMGDSGSLAIGGFIGYLAVVTKNEILLILIGIIFVIEALSVIIQVSSYKTRKKRVFLMAPIHHHFEMKKWAENKIIVRFWIISLLANIIALITIKLR